VHGPWRKDGPRLPVEFARTSSGGRLTLVLADNTPRVTVLWTELSVATLDKARRALAEREGIKEKNISRDIGCWNAGIGDAGNLTAEVGAWAAAKEITGVVWTALPVKFGKESRAPSAEEAVEYLAMLPESKKTVAEEYVRKAPVQIRTPFRGIFERKFGWTPISDQRRLLA